MIRGQGSETSSTMATPSEAGSEASDTNTNPLPPLLDLGLHGYASGTHRRLMDAELAANLRSLMPARLQLYDDWHLLYSLEQDGISLNTLYRHSSPEHQRAQRQKQQNHGYAENVVKAMVLFQTPGVDAARGTRPHGYVLVIEDEKRNKFGCFLNEHLRPHDHRRYYGNGECFLWKCEWFDRHQLGPAHGLDPRRRQRFKAFVYTGVNDNVVYSNHDFIAVGLSAGNNGLWIDKSLYLGVSYPCDTFGNEILNEHGCTGHKFGKFKIINLELWRVGDLA
ncbi:TLD-domain-containing protein [Metschnikowia bicuspidata var. bicuspidata NRRL YB-4993]|uniref:Oxidation resistance protein 1 n=1 Tax=Metschnikowia bicuspidata var. bicuspidata NRRL YB-4993 TaxID=869754 RepID=A0A1A0HCW3_9ASCO|nr:TLD-domain-containing protein [Metschnikowia bicuspidata var. bicuspidata NRRL YB-4993]OBA21856.1 TLD-domain-containing protein [Metschnikowia bicuspidata var. bicuspidata NRRL YB-4993]